MDYPRARGDAIPGPSGAAAGAVLNFPPGTSASPRGGPSSGAQSPTNPSHPKFDILQWYPQYQSCMRYFVEVSQHSYPCQALAAFINIKLPFQRHHNHHHHHPVTTAAPWISLHPYIRRLVASGFDVPAIMHGWFGDDWVAGIGPLHEQERRNYLFAAKSGGWGAVKKEYDTIVDEAIPYLKPLSRVEDGEILAAEDTWSKWLAMEDWMLGDRAPEPDEADSL